MRREPWECTVTTLGSSEGVELSMRRPPAAATSWRRGLTIAACVAVAALFSQQGSGARTLLLVALVSGALVSWLLPGVCVRETVTVLKGLGVQQRQSFRGAPDVTAFFPTSAIAAAVINEGIQHCDVRYYLALVVRGRSRLQLLLPESRPSLAVLCLLRQHMLPVIDGS